MGFRWTNIFAGRRHPTPALIGPCLLPAERWVPSTVAGGAAYGAALPPHASASESPRPRRGYLVAFPALRKLGPPGTWIRRRVGPAWLWHDRLGGQSWHWWLTRATSSAVTAGDPVGLRRPGRRRRWWRDSKHPGRGVAAEAADGAPRVARPGRIVRCTVRHWNGPPRGGGGRGAHSVVTVLYCGLCRAFSCHGSKLARVCCLSLWRKAATLATLNQFKSQQCFVNFWQWQFFFLIENEHSMDSSRKYYRPKQCFLLGSIFWPFIFLWVKTRNWTNQLVPNQILCRAADL